MVTFYIVYLTTLGLLTLLNILWFTIQEVRDNCLIKRTKHILIKKDGLPNPQLKDKFELVKIIDNLDVKKNPHPCRVHFPQESFSKIWRVQKREPQAFFPFW